MIYIWALVIVIVYLYMYYTGPKRKIDKMFPGPVKIPIFGNALLLIRSAEGINQLYFDLPKFYKYKTFRFWFLNKPAIAVTDYKVAKMILSSPLCVDKPDEYKLLDTWLGENFFFTGTEEKQWKRGRKAVVPAFQFNELKQHFNVFHKNAEILCKKLEKHDGKDAFDIYEYIVLYALDNVCDTVCGVNMQAQNNPDIGYLKALKGFSKVLYRRIVLLWLRSDKIFKMSGWSNVQRKHIETLHRFSEEIIRERKNKLGQKEADQSSEKDLDFQPKKSFIDSLIQKGQILGFADEEIRQTVDTLIFGGHDTVSSSLGFLLYALAEHQEIQEKVYQELETIFQKSDRCPTYDDLQEMKYTEQVIKECLRFFIVSPMAGRKSNHDLIINEKQYIPKNTDVWIHIGAIHRDPEIWPDPEKFDPERFSPEASQNRDPYSFLAFGAGPRSCLGRTKKKYMGIHTKIWLYWPYHMVIRAHNTGNVTHNTVFKPYSGYKFAMSEMKITLHGILRKFKVCLSDHPKDKPIIRLNLVATSANGIRIKVKSRNTD